MHTWAKTEKTLATTDFMGVNDSFCTKLNAHVPGIVHATDPSIKTHAASPSRHHIKREYASAQVHLGTCISVTDTLNRSIKERTVEVCSAFVVRVATGAWSRSGKGPS
jgi:hypothetical protein